MQVIVLSAFLFLITSAQKKTTLNILISAKNNIFYYRDRLAKDGSNFKASNNRNMIDWSDFLSKNYSKVFYVLKVAQKDSLNTNSEKLIQHFEHEHHKIGSLTADEKILIKATENSWAKEY